MENLEDVYKMIRCKKPIDWKSQDGIENLKKILTFHECNAEKINEMVNDITSEASLQQLFAFGKASLIALLRRICAKSHKLRTAAEYSEENVRSKINISTGKAISNRKAREIIERSLVVSMPDFRVYTDILRVTVEQYSEYAFGHIQPADDEILIKKWYYRLYPQYTKAQITQSYIDVKAAAIEMRVKCWEMEPREHLTFYGIIRPIFQAYDWNFDEKLDDILTDTKLLLAIIQQYDPKEPWNNRTLALFLFNEGGPHKDNDEIKKELSTEVREDFDETDIAEAPLFGLAEVRKMYADKIYRKLLRFPTIWKYSDIDDFCAKFVTIAAAYLYVIVPIYFRSESGRNSVDNFTWIQYKGYAYEYWLHMQYYGNSKLFK